MINYLKIKNKKQIIKIFLLIFISLLIFGFTTVTKADSSLPNIKLDPPDIKVSIPDLAKLQPVTCVEGECSIPWIGQYIAGFQNYAIKIVGIIAVITIMIGGIVWLTASGNQQKISEAKTWIISGISGLILTFGSYLLLYTINPNLTILKNIKLQRIDKIDLDEIQVESIETINENLSESKINISNYCGCFSPHETYSTSTLKTAEQVKELIRSINSKSPLINYAQNMIDGAKKYGIDPVLIVVKAKNENSLGTANSSCVKHYNIGSIKCSGTSGCKTYPCFTNSKDISYRSYSSWAEGIEDYFCFMKNSKTGNAPSMRELITRYCPPCVQKDGCCYTGKYIDDVVSYIQKYNTKNYDFDKPNGSNCNCYDLPKHCKDRGGVYCDK